MRQDVHPITSSVDMLWTITIFYAFYRLHLLSGYWPILLGILTTLLLINEWFSTRATFDFYTGPMFLADIADVFLYVCIYTTLDNKDTNLSYSVFFWLALSGIWFVYFIWDVFVIPYTIDEDSKKSLIKWEFWMFTAGVFTFGSFVILAVTSSDTPTWEKYYVELNVLQHINAGIILLVLYAWNKKKFDTVRKAFLEIGKK